MAVNSCEPCAGCNPDQFARSVDTYRQAVLNILCQILAASGGGTAGATRYDWEVLCDPEGVPILWRAEYDTDGTVVGVAAFNLNGTAYGGDITDLITCEGPPEVLGMFRSLDTSPTGEVVKASNGKLYNAEVFNSGDVVAYLKIYNQGTAPDDTDTPVKTWMIPPVSGLVISFDTPLFFSAGISIRATLGVLDTDTADPGTNVVVTNLGYL